MDYGTLRSIYHNCSRSQSLKNDHLMKMKEIYKQLEDTIFFKRPSGDVSNLVVFTSEEPVCLKMSCRLE